ncbi:2-C-methyl-D-erythritol 4-phosphate cytidylyltransferase [Oscillospiraceae bacterium OttesenSCG-928-G22]|nr:2-C-methyl-D-erythritol 4-phosphate cytidylyltransferase [Oscillospiraceae bacterium OttesenSCG-928-G22]
MGLFSFLKRKREKKRVQVMAVIAAGGNSTRMNGEDKLYMELFGAPLIARTLLAFEQCDCIDGIVVACAPARIVDIQDIAKEYGIFKLHSIVAGGRDRARSVLAGLIEARDADIAAIHDGARPLVSPELISRVVTAAKEHGAAIPGVALADTVKRRQGDVVSGTVDRSNLVAVQTPQAFDAGLIKGALSRAIEEDVPITDDAGAMEDMGFHVHIVEGEPTNIKITRPEDLRLAEGILAAVENGF